MRTELNWRHWGKRRPKAGVPCLTSFPSSDKLTVAICVSLIQHCGLSSEGGDWIRMWNLEWTGRDWIAWDMQLSKLYTKESCKVFIGHTHCSHGKGSKRFFPSRTPRFVETPLLLSPFTPLFTRSWMLPCHPEVVRNCSFCSGLAPPMMLTRFLAPKWSYLPCQQNAPFGVVWTLD